MAGMVALPVLWSACAIAAYFYARQYNIPTDIALAAFPAFLLEVTFYLALGLESWRARLEKLPRVAAGAALTLAAAAPYCAASLALGSFHWQALVWIAGLAAIASFWYVVLPDKPATDLLFLLFMAAVYLSHWLRRQYGDPYPRLQLDILGSLMWIRTGVFAMLSVRRMQGVGFGFWPGRWEWTIGFSYFAIQLPFVAAAAWAVGFARPHGLAPGWEQTTLRALGTFFGILWVTALGEEFVFRGLLQQWLGSWLRSEWAGLACASLLFGAAHFWYRAFPNWRFAAVAAVAGVFYGLAFRQARSIRASMVTHALTVTAWRLFFS
jgi:CAAX protease family protein